MGQPLAHSLAGRITRWREDQLEAQLREAQLNALEGGTTAAEGASNAGASAASEPDGFVVVCDSKDVDRVWETEPCCKLCGAAPPAKEPASAPAKNELLLVSPLWL